MERNEAIGVVRSFIDKLAPEHKEALSSLLPELAESEDERIRKSMLNSLKEAEDSIVLTPFKKKSLIAYLEKQKEQKPAEKQDYSGLTDFERAILRGLLCAGVDNATVTIIKETAQDCLSQIKQTEWSEEDEKMLRLCENRIMGTSTFVPTGTGLYDMVSWLKSLRPQPRWKPSEEQMDALELFIRSLGESGTIMSHQSPTLCAAKSLYFDLKLM